MSNTGGQSGFHLIDAAALTVGYSLASMLVRAYWPDTGVPPIAAVTVISLVFLWLGLAMSGPVVLLIRRPGPAPGLSVDDEGEEKPPQPRSWAELAWMIIGFYWIGLTILVVPVRMHGTRLLDSALLGVFPVLAALGLRFFGPRDLRPRQADTTSWTHRAGIGLLVTWPFAWVALILLGKTML
jgi:hypothetical protein